MLLDNAIIARIVALMTALVTGLEQVSDPNAGTQMYKLFRTSVTILSNLSQSESQDARIEILKFHTIDLMSRVLANSSSLDLETLDFILWFLHHLTASFETRHISPSSELPLIASLVRLLYLPLQQGGSQMAHQVVRNTVKTLVNLTKCSPQVFGREDDRADWAIERIVELEMATPTESFWTWVQNRVGYLTMEQGIETKEEALEVFGEVE